MIKLTVKAARVNAGFKSKEIAKFLGLSDTGYADKENGKNRFYADEAFRLSELFGVPYTIFFNSECPKMDMNQSHVSIANETNDEGSEMDEAAAYQNRT